MPRMSRMMVGDTVYHVINRSNGRAQIFTSDKDYQHFESLLWEAKELTGMRVLAYCIMPNHWHLVLHPKQDGDIGEYMRWVTTTHVRQRRVSTQSVGHGHLYQGAYKSFPIEHDKHLVDLIRYVEQNPLRAKLVKRAQEWRWSSLYHRTNKTLLGKKLLDPLPTKLPSNYPVSVNQLLNKVALESLRYSVNKGAPYGTPAWVETVVQKYDLGSTQRQPGRPRRV